MIAQVVRDPRLDRGALQQLRFPADRAFVFLDNLRRERYTVSILQELGLFSQAEPGTDSKVRYHSLNGDVFPIRSYDSSCDWNPVKVSYFNDLVEVDLCAMEVAIEYCEADMDACFRQLFQRQGLELVDFASTISNDGAGLQKWQATRNRIMDDIHNNLLWVAFFGQHPHLLASKEEGYYKMNAPAFESLYQSLQTCKGLITQADEIWENPGEYSQFKLELDVDGKGNYIGTPSEDFENVFSVNEVLSDVKYGESTDRPSSFLLVTDDVFQAYKKELKAQGGEGCCGDNGWLAAMMLGIENLPIVDRARSINGRPFSNSILEWEGIPVVNMSGFTKFDKRIGLKTSRIIGVRSGNFGWFTRGRNISREDMGMIITRKDEPESRGKVFVEAAFEMAPHILFPEMMTMARPAMPTKL